MLKQQVASLPATTIPEILPLRPVAAVPQCEMTPELLPTPLSAEVTQDIRSVRRGRQLQAILLPMPFLLIAVTPFLNMTVQTQAPFYAVLVCWAMLIFTNNYFLRRRGHRLAAIEDVRMTGALLDVFKTSGKLQGQDVKRALLRLLPRLKSSDADLVSPEQRKFLTTLLIMDQSWSFAGVNWDTDLKVAMLKALEQIGDEESLPVVMQVAQGARNLQVRQAAQDCLPFLQLRIDEQYARQLLLPSTASSVFRQETLLRAATGSTTTNPEELLRPTDSET